MRDDFAVISMEDYRREILGHGHVFLCTFFGVPVYLHAPESLTDEERKAWQDRWHSWYQDKMSAYERGCRDMEHVLGIDQSEAYK